MIEKYKNRYYAMKNAEGGEYAVAMLDELLIKHSFHYQAEGEEPKRFVAAPNRYEYRIAYLCVLLNWDDVHKASEALDLLIQYHLCKWDIEVGVLMFPSIYEPDVYERK